MVALSDFHVHPNYSIDGAGTIRQYCDRALEVGIRHLCFTTHYDANPKRVEQDGYWNVGGKRVRVSDKLLEIYFAEIERAGEFFSDFGLRVYRGFEIDYFAGVKKEVDRLRANFPIDFIVGSVHCLDDIAISDKNEAPAYFAKNSLSQMADDYFRLMIEAASFGGFDCLGHLDYYVRYGREYYGDEIDRIEIERFDAVFDKLVKSGVGIEINTSPFKYGQNHFHPRNEIIERAVESGVRIASVGSDSHKPEKLGIGVGEAFAFLEKMKTETVFPKT